MNKIVNRCLAVSLLKISPRSTSLFLVCLYFICLSTTYLTLVAPGESYINVWLNDMMGLIDIANRVHIGEVPYKDFHLMYGPLVALIPGWGFDLGLNAGTIFGFEGMVVAAFLLISTIIALPRRLTAASAGFVFLLVWLLSVVPLGEAQTFSRASWGTFYNRQGWAALIIVLLFYIEPKHIGQHDKWWDSVALAALVLFEIYVKFTFGAVALGFVVANAAVSTYNRQVSLRALMFIILVAGVLESTFHFHASYLHEILEQVGMVEGSRLDKWKITGILINNSAMIFGSIVAAFAAWGVGRRSVFDWLYVTGAILVTVLLRTTIGANQIYGTIALTAVFISMGELARRSETYEINDSESSVQPRWAGHIASVGCLFLAMTFVATEIANRLIAWEDFVVKVHNQSPLPDAPKRLASLLVPNQVEKWGPVLNSSEYMNTVIQGTNLLLSLNHHDHSVLTFDMVNPFPYAADMKPPAYGRPLFWLTGQMSGDPKRLPSPRQFIGDVDYVMVPRTPYDIEQLSNMQRIYGPYLRHNYIVLTESLHWDLWVRKNKGDTP